MVDDEVVINGRPRAMVLAPSPLLTVTVEAGGDTPDVIHLHAGGQGFWIARMLKILDVDVTLCATVGGESGTLVRAIVEADGVDAMWIDTEAANGAYIHDRRGGERRVVADMPATALSRHDVDDLYGLALTTGLEADVCVLGGPSDESVISAETYGRLAADLTGHGRTVVADLSGEALVSALAGGVALAKVSGEELAREGRLLEGDDVVAVLASFVDAGARNVVMTRAKEPAIALVDGAVRVIRVPTLHEVDHHGAGDSLTAGAASALARGASMEDALRLGAAAGALNVTRHGLASGRRQEIERMATHVVISST